MFIDAANMFHKDQSQVEKDVNRSLNSYEICKTWEATDQ